MPDASRPNVLLIYPDQHRYDCVGCHGHPQLRTPHMDRLAAEGMDFSHAFTPIPVCVPARASLYSGQWAIQHKSIANWDTEVPAVAHDDRPNLIGGLREAGYRLGMVAKFQMHPTRGPLECGFHDYVPESGYGPWRAAQGLPPAPHGDWRGALDPIPAAASRPAWGADHAIRLLRQYAADRRPFALFWAPGEPHLPNTVPDPYHSMYPPDTVAPWPSFPDPLAGKPFIQAQQRRTWNVDSWTWADWAPVVSRYLGQLSLIDAQVGRVLAALAEVGLAAQTLVVYATDHGDLCGGHGMYDKHYVMYDDVTHVPFILRWPGTIPAGRVCDAFVSHFVDLPRTLLEVAGAPVPPSFAGLSLLPMLAGQAVTNGREDIFATYHGNQFGLYSERMVRDRRWKYVWNATAEDELYDLQTDPGELVNRWRDPACAAELSRLRRRLVAWMEQLRDPLLNGWNRAQLLDGLKR